MYFLVNASPKPLDVATSNFAGALCRGYWATFCVTLVNVKGQKMYFLVNALPLKLLGVATLTFAVTPGYMM